MSLLQDEVRSDGSHAFHEDGVGARSFHAGNAGQVGAKDMMSLLIRAGAGGVGGAEDGDQGFSESGGDVHGAGVVSDDELGKTDPFDHFRQGRLAGQVEALARELSGDGAGEGLIGGTAEDGDLEVRLKAGEIEAELEEIVSGPAFIEPPGAWIENDPGAAGGGLPFSFDGREGIGARWEPLEVLMNRNIQAAEDMQVPVDGVGIVGWAWDG